MFGSQSLPGRERLVVALGAPRAERPKDKFPVIPEPAVFPVEAGLTRLKEEAKVDKQNKKLNKVVHINTLPTVITEQPHRDLFQPVSQEGLKTALRYVQTNEHIQTILGVNVLLRTGEFFLAEKMLGRPLTVDERVNRSMSESILPDKLSIFQFNKATPAATAETKTETKTETNAGVKTESNDSKDTVEKLEQLSKEINRLSKHFESDSSLIDKAAFSHPMDDIVFDDPAEEEKNDSSSPGREVRVLIAASPGNSDVSSPGNSFALSRPSTNEALSPHAVRDERASPYPLVLGHIDPARRRSRNERVTPPRSPAFGGLADADTLYNKVMKSDIAPFDFSTSDYLVADMRAALRRMGQQVPAKGAGAKRDALLARLQQISNLNKAAHSGQPEGRRLHPDWAAIWDREHAEGELDEKGQGIE